MILGVPEERPFFWGLRAWAGSLLSQMDVSLNRPKRREHLKGFYS